MATRVLHGIKFFEQFLKVTTKGTFLWSLDEIGLVVYEEMSFKVKVYGRTPDGRRMKSDHKSSPCHFVTGELKTFDFFDRDNATCAHMQSSILT
jgi:hypothetical protein